MTFYAALEWEKGLGGTVMSQAQCWLLLMDSSWASNYSEVMQPKQILFSSSQPASKRNLRAKESSLKITSYSGEYLFGSVD